MSGGVGEPLHSRLAFVLALIDSVGEGICAIDRDYRFTFVNPTAERLLGWSEGELLGRDARGIMTLPFDAVIHAEQTRRDDDAVFRCRDGTALAVAYSVDPIRVGLPIVGAVVVFRDIAARKHGDAERQRVNDELEARVRERTAALRASNAELQAELGARQRAETAVREREARLRLVLAQVPAVIWTTDADLRCTFAAGANLTALGLDPDRVVGLGLADVIEQVEAGATDLADEQRLLSLPAHRRAVDGTPTAYLAERQGRTYQVYVESLRDQGTIVGTIAIAQDITELSLRRLHDEFIATVSHQLLTPLAAAQAGLGLLDAGVGDRLGADDRRLLANIGRNIGRLGIHLNDLLTLNQLKAGTLMFAPVVIDLRAVVADAMAVVHPLLREKGQPLAVALPDALPVLGDAEELTQALINLLANAHRHTPGGTRVAISGRLVGDEVILTIEDSGPGGATMTGSGLGLAIVRGIVELHGGRAWTEAAPGGGAIFALALPQATEPTNGADG